LGSHIGVLDGRTTICDLEMACGGQQVDHWYSSREGKLYANYGIGSPREMARAVVLDGFKPKYGDAPDMPESRKNFGWSMTKPDLEQANKIMEIIDQGRQAGAISVASTVGYMRDGVSARELFEIVKVAAAYNRPCSMHFRAGHTWNRSC
jgi:N-acyl-D-glutamate deacylase